MSVVSVFTLFDIRLALTGKATTELSYGPISHSNPWAAISNDNITTARPMVSENFYPDEDRSAYDDELPDYATSQAQAQAHLRVEAARRAQELQQRWHLSGSQYGHRNIALDAEAVIIARDDGGAGCWQRSRIRHSHAGQFFFFFFWW